jgi:isopentenyldiphosphate isomerase
MGAAMNMPAHEIVQIVDRDNRVTGALPRHQMRSQGLIHRACYILVFNGRAELFVQKRTMIKDIYPGYWDVAAGGVVLAGESYEQSASRELAEELGVSGVPLTSLFDCYFEDPGNKVWGRIFRCTHEGPFILQPEEVESGMFMPIPQILERSRQEPFTPDGILILRQIFDH